MCVLKKRSKFIITISFIVILIVSTILYLQYLDYQYSQYNPTDDKLIMAFSWVYDLLFAISIYVAEIDVYHNVRYFCSNPEKRNTDSTMINSVASVLSIASLVAVVSILLDVAWQWYIILLVCQVLYWIIRFIHLIICIGKKRK